MRVTDLHISGPSEDCMSGPNSRLINNPVEDLTSQNGTWQNDKESNSFCRCGGISSTDVAVKENLDAGGVHEKSRSEIIT